MLPTLLDSHNKDKISPQTFREMINPRTRISFVLGKLDLVQVLHSNMMAAMKDSTVSGNLLDIRPLYVLNRLRFEFPTGPTMLLWESLDDL